MSVRAAAAVDSARIGQIAEGAGLFPAEYTAEMMAPALGDAPDIWLVAEASDEVAGFAFARPEEMTDRTWNVLAIAVDSAARGQGYGGALLARMEADLGARVIIIETTQRPEQDAARAFYTAKGYEQQGHVRDFYGDGEDKIIFRKALV